MNPEPDGIPFGLTQAEKSKAAWARIALEQHRRDTNRRDAHRAQARLAGQAAREFGLVVEGLA